MVNAELVQVQSPVPSAQLQWDPPLISLSAFSPNQHFCPCFYSPTPWDVTFHQRKCANLPQFAATSTSSTLSAAPGEDSGKRLEGLPTIQKGGKSPFTVPREERA